MTTFYDLYVFSAPDNCPATLHQQCFQHIPMDLQQFPSTSLALLPLKTRQQLLWSLPIADVCLLEATQFTEGMNMAKYWSAIVHIDDQDLGCHSECLDCKLENQLCSPCRWKTIVESTSAKEWVYAVIAAEAITDKGIMDKLPMNSNFKALSSAMDAMAPIQYHRYDDLFAFLYAARWFSEAEDSRLGTTGIKCEFEFPLRYIKYGVAAMFTLYRQDQFCPMNATERKFLLNAIVCCFGGKKPSVLCTQRSLLEDISEEVPDFLSDLKYFTCQIHEPLKEMPSLKTVLRGTVCLEVLHVQNDCRCSWSPVDDLFHHITDQPFLASLNILAVSEAGRSHFTVSKDMFDKIQGSSCIDKLQPSPRHPDRWYYHP